MVSYSLNSNCQTWFAPGERGSECSLALAGQLPPLFLVVSAQQ